VLVADVEIAGAPTYAQRAWGDGRGENRNG